MFVRYFSVLHKRVWSVFPAVLVFGHIFLGPMLMAWGCGNCPRAWSSLVRRTRSEADRDHLEPSVQDAGL